MLNGHCRNVDKGDCLCDDDGLVSHGGVRHEGFAHGYYVDGAAVRA